MTLQFHKKVTIQEPSPLCVFGYNQVAVINWATKVNKTPVCLVPCDKASRLEFGPGCFRAGAGEMVAEFIIKIDQRTMQAFFVDNELYTNEGLIQWEPIKLTKLQIDNLELFEDAFRS